eukprot:gene5208-4604_t
MHPSPWWNDRHNHAAEEPGSELGSSFSSNAGHSGATRYKMSSTTHSATPAVIVPPHTAFAAADADADPSV